MRKWNKNQSRRAGKHKFSIGLPLLLASTLCMMSLPTGIWNVQAAAKEKNTGEKQSSLDKKEIRESQISKEEVIYSSLAADGRVKEIYVVNAFNLPEAGEVSDYGEYSLLENLTDTKELSYEDGHVSTQAEKGRFYYQGNMVGRKLPWNVQVSYTLDKKTVSAQQLAGAAGKVGISILTAKNQKTDPIFYEKYMLQVTVTLDTSICENIRAKDATIANAGSDKQVTFTVMPEKNGRLEVTLDAKDFAMKGISIAAVPFSAGADMLDVNQIDQLTEGLEQLSSGISQLNGGAQQLKGGAEALKHGTDELKSGVSEFQDGVLQLKTGADEMSGGASLLCSGSGEFQEGLNRAAALSDEILSGSGQIDQAMQGLKAGTADMGSLDLKALTALPAGLNGLADGLEGMQAGFVQIFQTLNESLDSNPVQVLTQEELGELGQAVSEASPEAQAAYEKMLGSYQSAMVFLGTYQAVRDQIDGLVNSIGDIVQNIRGTAEMLEPLEDLSPDSLTKLADGISTLADKYAGFHQGLSEYMDGIKKMSSEYEKIDGGLQDLADGAAGLSYGMGQSIDGAAGLLDGVGSLNGGASDLSKGVSQLADGLGTLNQETKKMPEEMKTKIDEMMEKYTNADFKPVSFTSSKNKNVVSVQFVLSTEEIKKEKEKTEKAAKEPKESVWEKFTGLFQQP